MPAATGTPAAAAELSPRGTGAPADSEERGEDKQRRPSTSQLLMARRL